MRWLQQETRNGVRGWLHLAQAALAPGEPDADTAVNLERMQLAAPRGIRERLLARLVRGALARSRAAESTGTQES
jgi:hypothetical protein